MRIEKYDRNDLKSIYRIQGKLLDIPKEAVYMGSMLGHLTPQQATRNHAHHDHEQFIIIQGQGSFSDGQTKFAVKSGDVIHIEPGDSHILKNEHSVNDLIFTSTWWAYEKGADIKEKPVHFTKSVEQHLLLSPPPTPNGDLHLGHLAGPYLGVDILKRHLSQLGHSVFYLTGSDDNQSYVTLKANQLNTTSAEVANSFSENIQTVFSDFKIAPHAFYRPLHDPDYSAFVQSFFKTLFTREALTPKTVMQPFCSTCQHWLFEAHIGGFCPHCHEKCGGGGCETCGFPNNTTDMLNTFCKYCKQSPILLQTQKMYLTLKDYEPFLTQYWETLALPAHIRTFLRNLLEKGLPDIAVTHHSDWGIPAPFVGFENQTLCSWSEMIPGYLFSLERHHPKKTKWENLWNDNHKITLFFGFDNTFFYMVVMPALLLAYDNIIKLPDNFIYNEFYLFEQEKFSTSRSHAVWAKDIIHHFPLDAIRYYLAASRPEQERTQFNYATFIEVINRDLVHDFSTWIFNLSKKIQNIFHGKCPDGGEWNIEHDTFILFLSKFLVQCKEAYHVTHFSPATIIRLLRELTCRSKQLSSSALFLQGNSFSQLEHQTTLVLELTALKYYAIVCAPIMPTLANQIKQALCIAKLIWEDEIKLIPKNTPISNLEQCIFSELKYENFNLIATQRVQHETQF